MASTAISPTIREFADGYNFNDFFFDELMPFVHNWLPASARPGRQLRGRVLHGRSRGLDVRAVAAGQVRGHRADRQSSQELHVPRSRTATWTRSEFRRHGGGRQQGIRHCVWKPGQRHQAQRSQHDRQVPYGRVPSWIHMNTPGTAFARSRRPGSCRRRTCPAGPKTSCIRRSFASRSTRMELGAEVHHLRLRRRCRRRLWLL